MKKRLAKMLALGLTAAMAVGAPLSAMAAETDQADAASTVVEETSGEETETAAQDAEGDEGIATQELVDSSEEPVTGGVDPMSLNGVVRMNDGNWYYFDHGTFHYVNGLYPNSAGWWYVQNGKVDFSYEGLAAYSGSDWYVKNGQIQFGYTGPVQITVTNDWTDEEEQAIYYIRDGRVDYDFTGLAQATLNGEAGWFYFVDGQWDPHPATSLAEYGGSWWYIVEDGKVDFNYEGTVFYNDVEWYVRGGSVDFGYTGRAEGYTEINDDFKVPFQTYFVNGMQDLNLTGVYYTEVEGNYGWYGFYHGQLANRDWYFGPTIGYVLSNEGGWWYINPDTGMVDFTYTGMAENDYGTWYMSNGQIDFGYNGLVKQRPYGLGYPDDYYDVYMVTGGKADTSYEGIVWATIEGVSGWYGFVDGSLGSCQALMKKDDGTWWYVDEHGKVDFSYTGNAVTPYGYYYVRNGQIDFGFTGTAREYGTYYGYYQNGKAAEWDFNGLVETTIDGEYGWYYVQNGVISHDHEDDDADNYISDLVSNAAGWWAVANGKVEFDYTGFVYDSVTGGNGLWYVRNGQIDFGANGFIKDPSSEFYYYYVNNGYANFDLYTVAQGTINGETAWWGIESGGCVPGDIEGIAEYDGKVWYYSEGKIDFSKSGTYVQSYSYMVDESTLIQVTYKGEVVNGQVISMTVDITDLMD